MHFTMSKTLKIADSQSRLNSDNTNNSDLNVANNHNEDEIIDNDEDDDQDEDEMQQLTFISNKTFPLDIHCHHPIPSSSSSSRIETILNSVLPSNSANLLLFADRNDMIVEKDHSNLIHKSTSNPLRPPPPSPRTPPLRSVFQSLQSIPIARFDENGEVCIDNNIQVQDCFPDDDDGSSSAPPPYHRFDMATTTTINDNSNFDYIDSQLTLTINNDNSTIHLSVPPQISRQQSYSTTELNLKPPEFDQLFDYGFNQKQFVSTTPTPYARLIHFKQHRQHLNVPSPTSSLLRRRSLPPHPFSNQPTIINSEQQTIQSSSQAMASTVLPPKEKRIGHRRVNEEGQVTYKKIKSTQLMYSIQLGIGYSVGSMASKPERDLLMRDFMQIETVNFPKSGSQVTPAHHYTDFTFSTYTPFAFRYFRDLFRIQPDDFMLSITNESLQEQSNPGASGSMFFRTKDDQFIIKTVEKNEAKFLLKLLPGYYMNLSQNPHTLLPKFFGLYCYECIGKNIRILVMNNLLPSNIKIHQKYDLKGSTYKRKATSEELKKSCPTYKDLDFLEYYYNDENKTLITHFSKMAELTSGDLKTFPTDGGLLLEAQVYDEVIGTLMRDCRVLQSFEIMDYSLLIGVHNYDRIVKENLGLKTFNYDNDDELPPGAVRAMNRKGERLLLFMGIIDILQSYRLMKKVEHAWKSILYDGSAISVTKPDFYAKRFLDFMCKKVFGRLPDHPQGPSSPFSESNHYRHNQINHSKRNRRGNHLRTSDSLFR